MARLRLGSVLLACIPAALMAQAPASLPLKHTPQPTVPAITAPDLMTRLYIFADDSMMGREAGTEGQLKGSAYIEREVRKLGLVPAGDNGGYFQDVPMVKRTIAATSALGVDGAMLTLGTDFAPANGRGVPRAFNGSPIIFGGVAGGDSSKMLTADQAAGKVVVIVAPRGGGGGGGRGGRGGFPGAQFAGAAAVVIVGGDALSPQQITGLKTASIGLKASNEVAGTINVTTAAAQKLLGVSSLDGLSAGAMGKTARGAIALDEVPAPTRNVVAIWPGSDPKLKGEFVAIGAHSDHIGMRPAGVDKDSLRAYNTAREAITMSLTNGQRPTAEQMSMIKINMDSIRKLYPVARRDSINNGADDDGSGSVGVLEIAEAFAKSATKPKRSILFVWHTGEEKGLLGSRWFTDHPTVVRDSIVAQLNIDMIGRGGTADALVATTKEGEHVKGTPDYVELVGSRRLSTELGDMVETVNGDKKLGLTFDYSMDANGHTENIYCRSDHANYARFGIPIVFFTTGLHKDYHQLTDEPQLIDYPHFARVTQLVYDVAQRVANLDHRVLVDKPKPAPTAACRQ